VPPTAVPTVKKPGALPLDGSIVFLDPPWGGPDYADKTEIELELSGVPLALVRTRNLSYAVHNLLQ
jgi:RNA cap guanine-N2 methyltransferase